jgi:hypothetical protein
MFCDPVIWRADSNLAYFDMILITALVESDTSQMYEDPYGCVH